MTTGGAKDLDDTHPGIPRRLASSRWGDYLDQRAELVTALATATAPSSPSRAADGGEWLDRLPVAVRQDPRCGDLSERLAQLAGTRRDVPALAEQAVASGPLPTEVPADALWWRVAGAAATTPQPPRSQLVPPTLRPPAAVPPNADTSS